jgi:hypothetical protein
MKDLAFFSSRSILLQWTWVAGIVALLVSCNKDGLLGNTLRIVCSKSGNKARLTFEKATTYVTLDPVIT